MSGGKKDLFALELQFKSSGLQPIFQWVICQQDLQLYIQGQYHKKYAFDTLDCFSASVMRLLAWADRHVFIRSVIFSVRWEFSV